jgi:hypothetical protein
MSDAPTDRMRGLGLLVQLLVAVTFVMPANKLVRCVFDEFTTRGLLAAAPLASQILQFVSGWAIVHKRQHAMPFAIATLVVALAILGISVVESDDMDALSVVVLALSTAGWPTATLIAVLRAPRVPFIPRRADLGGAVLAYGLLQLLVGTLWMAGIALTWSRFFGGLEPWQLVVTSSPLLGVMVMAVFAVLAGGELARAPRPGRSRLTMYLIVSMIVPALMFALTLISMLAMDVFDRRTLKVQVALLVLGFVSNYAVPFVLWCYARQAKPLDVADSAGAASSLRWASLYLAIPMTARVLEEFASGFYGPGALVLGTTCAQIVLAIAIFFDKRRRVAMWLSLGVCALSIASLATVLIASGEFVESTKTLWPSWVTLGVFAALAWLHRPGVRSERSLAAIFE